MSPHLHAGLPCTRPVLAEYLISGISQTARGEPTAPGSQPADAKVLAAEWYAGRYGKQPIVTSAV